MDTSRSTCTCPCQQGKGSVNLPVTQQSCDKVSGRLGSLSLRVLSGRQTNQSSPSGSPRVACRSFPTYAPKGENIRPQLGMNIDFNIHALHCRNLTDGWVVSALLLTQLWQSSLETTNSSNSSEGNEIDKVIKAASFADCHQEGSYGQRLTLRKRPN